MRTEPQPTETREPRQRNCDGQRLLAPVTCWASRPRLYTFFLKDESIHEIKATDAEAALQMLGEKLEKPAWLYRYWLLQEITTCLTPI